MAELLKMFDPFERQREKERKAIGRWLDHLQAARDAAFNAIGTEEAERKLTEYKSVLRDEGDELQKMFLHI